MAEIKNVKIETGFRYTNPRSARSGSVDILKLSIPLPGGVANYEIDLPGGVKESLEFAAALADKGATKKEEILEN